MDLRYPKQNRGIASVFFCDQERIFSIFRDDDDHVHDVQSYAKVYNKNVKPAVFSEVLWGMSSATSKKVP